MGSNPAPATNRARWAGSEPSKKARQISKALQRKGVSTSHADAFSRSWVEGNQSEAGGMEDVLKNAVADFKKSGGKFKGESVAANYNTDPAYWVGNGQTQAEAEQSAENARGQRAADDSSVDSANEALANSILDGTPEKSVSKADGKPYSESVENAVRDRSGPGESPTNANGERGFQDSAPGGDYSGRSTVEGGRASGPSGAASQNIASGEAEGRLPASADSKASNVARGGDTTDVDRAVDFARDWIDRLNKKAGFVGARAVRLVVEPTEETPHTTIQDDGVISISIDPSFALDQMAFRFNADAADGPKWLNDAINEELIHVADFLAGREKWEAANSPESARDFWKKERRKDITVLQAALSGKNGEVLANAILQGIFSYDLSGRKADGITPETWMQGLPGNTVIEKAKAYLDASKNGVGVINTGKDPLFDWQVASEVLREIVQVRRSGEITEQGYRAMVGRLVEWMRGVTKYLRMAGETPEIKDMIRRIEEILDFAEGGDTTGKSARPPPENGPESGNSQKLAPAKFADLGKTGEAYTDNNDTIEFQWAAAELADLIISNEDSGRVNPRFPKEFQPRDRSSVGSQAQVEEIANNSNFDRLSFHENVGGGAPIVGPEDAVVESGNGRLMGLRRAYERNLPSVAKYRAKLSENAAALGLDVKKLDAMKHPVLVRIRRTEVDRKKFTEIANVSNVAPMREVEVAKKDASNISTGLLGLFTPTEDGDIFSPSRFLGSGQCLDHQRQLASPFV